MARSYAELEDVYQGMLNDDGTIYGTTVTDLWSKDALREIASYDPHIVETLYKIESRTGIDTAGDTDKLTDDTKSQFVATTDATLEKVVHNTKDNTWAVVTASSSTVLTLSRNIFTSGDTYKIYNKRCRNDKQIFIGDVTDNLWIDSVEYPVGTMRNWKVYGDILEIDVDRVVDSDSTLDPPSNVDVLVRYAKVHKLCQLTDLDGACSATEPELETSIALKELGTTETIEAGDEFHIADHKTVYTVTVGKLLSGGIGSVTVTPGMESATADDDAVTFVKSTLKPHHEEIYCQLVAIRTIFSSNLGTINAINKGGPDTWRKLQQWAESRLADAVRKLENLSTPRTKRRYPSA